MSEFFGDGKETFLDILICVFIGAVWVFSAAVLLWLQIGMYTWIFGQQVLKLYAVLLQVCSIPS